MTFLFWFAVIFAVAWGVIWAAVEIFEAWSGDGRHDDIDELARRL